MRQTPVEALLPGDVRAETGREAEGLAPRRHRRATRWPCAAHRSRRPSRAWPRRPGSAPASSSTAAKSSSTSARCALGGAHGGDLHDVRADLDAERAQERLCQRPACHARRGLARGGALEDVAHVALLVLPGAHQVGVPGSGQMDLGDRVGGVRHGPRVHALLPVGVVAVGDLQRHGPAERAPVADTPRSRPPRRARSSCAPRGRGRAGGGAGRRRSPRSAAAGPRAAPRRSR